MHNNIQYTQVIRDQAFKSSNYKHNAISVGYYSEKTTETGYG